LADVPALLVQACGVFGYGVAFSQLSCGQFGGADYFADLGGSVAAVAAGCE
jgi:hypothetical protein